MDQISIPISDIIYFCGFIAAIWGVVKIIKEIKKPSNDLKTKVEEHEKKLTKDNKRLVDIEEYNKTICKSLLALIDHEITGNGIDKLKTTKTELQNFLIER